MAKVGVGLCLFVSACSTNPPADPQQQVRAQFVADAVQRFDIAKRNGSPMDACVAARAAATAFLVVKDEPGYAQWKKVEEAECTRR
jgi:predicted component of type VI protein secretion system